MDEQQNNSAESQNQNSGDNGGGEEAPPAWYAGLPDDLKSNPAVTRYATAEDAARGIIHANGKLRAPAESLIEIPKPDDEKAWGAVFDKMGRPEKPEGYNLQLPADASEELKTTANNLAATAHKAGLTPRQLAPLVEMLNKATTDAAAAEAAAQAKAAADCAATLKTEWGDKFPVYSGEINKLVMDTVGKEGFDHLNQTGFANDPVLMRMLAKISDMRAEPGKPGGEGGRADTGVMTPAVAKAELAKIQTDPETNKALQDGGHPQHQYWVDRRLELMKLANPQSVS